MADPKGFHLLVNVSAAEARRRLKGFGHGVRKIRSGGKKQADIIHTATGQHFQELTDVFADVGFSATDEALSEPVENVRNLGTVSAAWLREAGIKTRADLESLGPLNAYRRVAQRQPQSNLNLLWALVAGLQDRDWRELSEQEKQQWRSAMQL